MAIERGAEPTDVVTQVQRLASLWRAVTSLPMHPAGCTCMGHLLIPALNARDMEADILDYIINRDYIEIEWPAEFWPARDEVATPEQSQAPAVRRPFLLARRAWPARPT